MLYGSTARKIVKDIQPQFYSMIMRFNPCLQIPQYRSVLCMNETPKDPGDSPAETERPLFAHPPWMVGVVLALAVLAIIAGLEDPIWLLLGLPCILVLALYVYVRIIKLIRGRQ